MEKSIDIIQIQSAISENVDTLNNIFLLLLSWFITWFIFSIGKIIKK